MPKPWMIYGANGYTGELIAREAVTAASWLLFARPDMASVRARWLRALTCRRASLISGTAWRPRAALRGWRSCSSAWVERPIER